MLSFASPWALALFTVCALIALFYFLRTRFHRQPVSSTFLWKRLVRVNEGGARLRRRSALLLILQLAAAALVILALSDPRLTLLSASATGTVYVLDTSASMGARESGGTRIELAGRAIAADAPRGPVAVLAGERQFFSSDGTGLREFLAGVRTTDGGFQIDEAVASVRAWTKTHEGTWKGVLVTDGGADGARLYQAFGGSLRTLDFAGDAPNVGIVDLRVDDEARLTFFDGFSVSKTVTVSLTGAASLRRTETLPPGTSTVVWVLPRGGGGLWTARLEGWHDALEADDTFRLSIEASRPLRVVHLGPANPFLASALVGAVYEDRSTDAGTWDLAIAEGALPHDQRSTVYFGLLPGSPVTAGPEVSGTIEGAAASVLSRWVNWDEIRVKGGHGLIVPPDATVLAEIDGWPVAAAWTRDGQRYLALGFDTQTSNVGLTSALPILMRNFRQDLFPQEGNPLASTLRVGEPVFRAGSEHWHAESGLDAARRGLWQLTALRAGTFGWNDGEESGIIAANLPAAESDTAPRALPLPPPAEVITGGAAEHTVPFGWTLALAALILLAAEWRLWNGRFDPRSSPRAAWLRAATAAAAALALAGLVLPWPTAARNVVLLVDVSDSQGPLVEAERQAALKYLGNLSADDRAAIVVFGSQPRILSPLIPVAQAKTVLEAAAEQSLGADTDLAAALATGAALLKNQRGAGIEVLFSDGRATKGGTLGDLKPGPYPVYAVPFGRPLSGIAAEGLQLTPARQGETAEVQWSGWTDVDRTARFEVWVDGQMVQTREVGLKVGTNNQKFVFEAGPAGTRRVDVKLRGDPAGDASGLLTVDGPAAVLVVSGLEASPALMAALARQGLVTQVRQPAALPDFEAGYQGLRAVVFDNVPASLTKLQERSLKAWVADGGGLLVIGGASSFGRGGYFSSDLEDLLPVSTDSRRRLQFTRTRMLFVVDHSGSMSEPVGNTTKIEAAVAGVARTLQDLSPQDEVGILQFDSEASWVLPFTPVSNKPAILEALGSFTQGGGTELTSALDEVMKVFSAPGPVKRHVVLLTDGQTGVDDAFYGQFTDAMRDAEVSLTVLGIGDQVNEPLLRDLAAGTGGIFYHADGPDIPQLLHGEAIRVTRDQIQEGRFDVASRGDDPVLELGGPPPPVFGYLVTRPKPLAHVGWAVPRADGLDPLYADWRYGAGRVAVFTSDSGRRWLAGWSGRPEYNRFWGQAVRALSINQTKDLDVAVTVAASVAHVTVEARENGRLRSGASLAVTHGLKFPLTETAPGHYEAEVPLDEPGLAVFTVTDPARSAQVSSWAWTPASAETVRGGVDWASLSRFTSASGGRLEPAAAPSVPPVVWSWAPVPLRDALLMLALTLFVVELARRSLSVEQLRQAWARGAVWWRDQRRPWIKAPAAVAPRSDAEAERRTRDAYRYLAQRRKRNP